MAHRSRNGQGTRVASTRDWTILLVLFIIFACILARLVWVQVIDAESNAEKARSAHTSEISQTARRGTIYDRNGETIAASVDATTIYADPGEVGDPVQLARVMARHLEEPYGLGYSDCYELITTQGTSFVYVKRKADVEVAQALREELESQNLKGLHYLEDTKRVYPNGSVGEQVVGSTDVDGNGIAGLELQYDDLLSGEGNTTSVLTGRTGTPIVGGGSASQEVTTGGSSIKTSIDIKLQERCETSLLSAIEEYKAKGGSATVLDAATGEIYAACSFTRDDDADTEGRQASSYKLDSGKIWSIADSYEPGSTFKALTAVCVLANSDATPDTVFDVPAKLQVYDSTVTDSHEHGDVEMSFTQIMAESSNIGMVKAGELVSNEELYETFKAFGIGDKPAMDFPGVAGGVLEQTGDWDGVQEADITFGQGVSTTALQMARAFAAIEQDGTLRIPHFLVDVPGQADKASERLVKLSVSAQAADAGTCNLVTDMMRAVVTDSDGTGDEAAIEGFDVVGKTGTAEIADGHGSYAKDRYIVSFGGWLEGSTSDLVCFVTVEEPETQKGGGPVCGPVFADIMSFAIGCYQISPRQS